MVLVGLLGVFVRLAAICKMAALIPAGSAANNNDCPRPDGKHLHFLVSRGKLGIQRTEEGLVCPGRTLRALVPAKSVEFSAASGQMGLFRMEPIPQPCQYEAADIADCRSDHD